MTGAFTGDIWDIVTHMTRILSLIMFLLLTLLYLSTSGDAGREKSCLFLQKYLKFKSLSQHPVNGDDVRSVYHNLLYIYKLLKEFPQYIYLKSERTLYLELLKSDAPSQLIVYLSELGKALSDAIGNGHCQKLDLYFENLESKFTYTILVFSSVLRDHTKDEDRIRVCLSKLDTFSRYSLRGKSISKWLKLSFLSCARLSRSLKLLQFHVKILLEVRKVQQSEFCRKGVQLLLQQCSPSLRRQRCCSACAVIIDKCVASLSSISNKMDFTVEQFQGILKDIEVVLGVDFQRQVIAQATTGNRQVNEEAADEVNKFCAKWPVTPDQTAELRAEDARQEAYLRQFKQHRLNAPLPAFSLQTSLEALRKAHTAVLAGLQRMDEWAQLVKQHFGQTCRPGITVIGGETGPHAEAIEQNLSQNDQPQLADEVLPRKPITMTFEDDINFWVEDYNLQPEVDYADAPYETVDEEEPREGKVQATKSHQRFERNHTSREENENVRSTIQSDRQQPYFNACEISSSSSPHHPRYKYLFLWIICSCFAMFLHLLAPA